MAFDPNLFTVNIDPTPASIVLGKTDTVTATISNANLSDWGYNLSLEMTIPDGVSFDSALIPPTSQTLNPDNTITLKWINVTDLAPNELGYTFPVTLKSDEKFREAPNDDVPFDIPLTPVSFDATIDTKPRGSGEPDNDQYTESDSTSIIPARYSIKKIVPDKYPKGAGIPGGAAPQWSFTHEIIVENNSRESSTVDITDIMDNGMRFIGPISVVGPDSVELSPPNPIVTVPSSGGQDNVTIEWNNIVLSPSQLDNTISYDIAFWDNYTLGGIENSGDRILHGTEMDNSVTMTGESGSVSDEGKTLAMDLTIDKSQTPTTIDIGQTVDYTLAYAVNQYNDLDSVIVTDVVGDAQTYVIGSAIPVPFSISAKDPLTGETTIVWDIGSLTSSASGNITFSTIIDDFYTASTLPADTPVVAGDTVNNNVSIDGINIDHSTSTLDTSSSSGNIITPTITKELLNIYYKDGTLKPSNIQAVAPGDFVEFQINYFDSFDAAQKEVYIDDFFPLSLDATGITNDSYSPFDPDEGPLETGNNGLTWLVSDFIQGMSFWSAIFRVPMLNVDFVGTEDNLAKLRIMNTTGIVYSDRDQIPVNFGQPNVTLSKDVAGPTPDSIIPGQTYVYTIVIKNPQNVDETNVDAFDFDLSDVIPNEHLLYVVGTLSAIGSSGTPTFDAPVFTAPDLIDMHITELKPNDEITVTYSVLVEAGIGINLTLTNTAETTSPYSQPFDEFGENYQYPGLEKTASSTLMTLGTEMTKTVDNVDNVVGNEVNYTITLPVPAGLTAYDVVISDILPVGQSYDGNPMPVAPASISGQTITWPTIPVVDSTLGAIILTYSFRAKIDSSISTAPTYTEVQTNTAKVNWDSSPEGGDPRELDATVDVNVRNPHLLIEKSVRNITKGESLFSTLAIANPNDIIEYKLVVENDGSADAYNINITDEQGGLNPAILYLAGSIIAPYGTTANYDATYNLIDWNIPLLTVGSSLELIFRVTVNPNASLGTFVPNTGSVDSYSNENLEFIYPSETSNQANIIIEGEKRGIGLAELAENKNVVIETMESFNKTNE